MKGAMMDAQQKAARAFRDQTISELAAGQQVHAAQARVAANDQVRERLTTVMAAPGSARCLHAWWVRLPRPVGVKGLICLSVGAQLLSGALLPVQVVAEMRSAAEAAEKRAADARDGARISENTMAAALSRVRAAETALSAAQHDMQLARAEAGAAQVRILLEISFAEACLVHLHVPLNGHAHSTNALHVCQHLKHINLQTCIVLHTYQDILVTLVYVSCTETLC